MNTLPSMDRHIQQTNDRLQCIKQVGIKWNSWFSFFTALWKRTPSGQRQKKKRKKEIPALLSPFTTLFRHQCVWALSFSHTDHVAEGHRRRQSAYEHKSRLQSCIADSEFVSPRSVFSDIMLPAPDVCQPSLPFCLNASLTVSFQKTSHRH